MWYTLQSGIVYGPYGGVGLIQRQDLRDAKMALRGLFRWVKHRLGR